MAGRNVDRAQPGRRMDRIGCRAERWWWVGRMETARRARRQKKNGKDGPLVPSSLLARSGLSLGCRNVELKEEGNKLGKSNHATCHST
jgi:hypothetical protein